MRICTMPRERLVRELSSTLIFKNLSARELRRFSRVCEIREYDGGEVLVEQDTVGSDLLVLLTGALDIRLRGRDGAEVTVNTIQKGDVLGEASIFTQLPRTASAVARGGCLVAIIPRESLFAFCDKNAKAGLKIFTFVIYSLLKRLGATTRDLVTERESLVTREDLENLRASFPKSLEDMLEG